MADENMSEAWRPVQGYPDFEVSESGIVRRAIDHHRTPKTLPAGSIVPQWEAKFLYVRKDGSTAVARYMCVSISRASQGKRRSRNILVSRIVCEAFHGAPPSKKHHAAHCDGNSLNNHESNLRWATPAENQADRDLHGTSNKGSRHGMSKLTEERVVEIINRLAHGTPDPEVAKEFGVSIATVLRIRRGDTWKHVPRPIGFEGQHDRAAVTTKERAEKIIGMLDRGLKIAAITESLGISAGPIKAIKAGRLFPDLPRSFAKRASPYSGAASQAAAG